MSTQKIPPSVNVKDTKEFFSSSMRRIFTPAVNIRSAYGESDVLATLRNSIAHNLYIETYVRNYGSRRTPSGDTMFRLMKRIGSEPDSHRRKGSHADKRGTVRTGMDEIQKLLDLTVERTISLGAFSIPVNVAIDEHDHPYYGMDNRYLVGVGSHKFRGTGRVYRFATLESVKKGERLALSVMRRDQLDGIDNSREVRTLMEHALHYGIRINIVLMDRGYLDAGVMSVVDSMHMKYIVPAKGNNKTERFRKMDMTYSVKENISYLVAHDRISSGNVTAHSSFVHVLYYRNGEKHDFSFYTNMEVAESNVMYLAETYRERWGIENGYQEKIAVEEKTHSPDMGVRYFIFYFSVLLYNLWILINIMRRISGSSWMVFMDFIIAMMRGRWSSIVNDFG